MKLILPITILLIALTGCQENKQDTTFTIKLNYFKDVYGICYASVISNTYGGYDATSITTVPCNKVKL